MSNGSPDSSGQACLDTFNEDVLRTFSGGYDCQSMLPFEDWLQDAISDLDGTLVSCEVQPAILVDLPLETDDTVLQSPFSTPALDQQPCAEADFLGLLYDSATQAHVYGDTPYPQQSSGFSARENIIFEYLNSNTVPKQYDVIRTSPFYVPSCKTRPDTAQILEAPLLKHSASPKSAHAESQRPLHRCESRIAKAQFPFEQTTCGQTFARSKDLKRHQSSVHREDNDPVYICRCGKDDPRKDNHARHVGVCVKPPCPRPYVCKCSHPSQERDDHLEHVKSCSPGKRSRRRQNAS